MHHADWRAYCDICGQRYWASELTKLDTYTGRGGLIVCPKDRDQIDAGLIPYATKAEKNVPWTRPGDNNTDNGSPLVDLEDMTYILYLAASQDSAILMASQDDAWLIPGIPVL